MAIRFEMCMLRVNVKHSRGKHEFLQPDYMVHHTYNSKGDHPDHHGYVPSSGYAPRRATFEHDGQSAFQRDRNPTVSLCLG